MSDSADLSADLCRIEIELAFCLKALRPPEHLAHALVGIIESLQGATLRARHLERLVLETPPPTDDTGLDQVALSVLHPHARETTS